MKEKERIIISAFSGGILGGAIGGFFNTTFITALAASIAASILTLCVYFILRKIGERKNEKKSL